MECFSVFPPARPAASSTIARAGARCAGACRRPPPCTARVGGPGIRGRQRAAEHRRNGTPPRRRGHARSRAEPPPPRLRRGRSGSELSPGSAHHEQRAVQAGGALRRGVGHHAERGPLTLLRTTRGLLDRHFRRSHGTCARRAEGCISPSDRIRRPHSGAMRTARPAAQEERAAVPSAERRRCRSCEASRAPSGREPKRASR